MDSRTIVLPILVAILLKPILAQEPPQEPPVAIAQPILVTASRIAQPAFEAPYASAVVADEQIRRRAYRTTPQALRDVPGVMIQETAHGHGSPYIRGFTSFRTLFMVDGIRLNNSVFRPGPNQYWNTVDPLSLDRIEVVKGPSSVLYGSDAVGGTVNAFTRSPWTYGEGGTAYGGSTYLSYATAEDSLTGRGEISLGHTWEGGTRTGVLMGGSARAFGDLEGGDGVGTQPETGYEENDFDVKVEHWLDDDTRLTFAHYRVAQDDVPRTHRTVYGLDWRGLSVGSDMRRSFDQRRQLTYAQLHKEAIDGPVEAIRASLSWHRQEEVRDRVRGNGNQELQGFDVGTFGASIQLESTTPAGHLTYGVEYYRDDVDSFLNKIANPSPADSIQGPVADDANYDLLGIYFQDRLELTDRLEITLGGRFNYAAVDADSVRDSVTDTAIAIDDDWSDFVGSLRFRFQAVPDHVNVYGGVSQGFRAPNLSDLSRFDSARGNEFEVPAPNLDAEKYLGYEVGVKGNGDDVNVEVAYFYTDIDDQILRFPTGNTNAAGEVEITKANIGDGQVWGIETGAAFRFLPEFTAFGNATYTEGRVTNFESPGSALMDDWISRLMPLTAQLGVRWEDEQGRLWSESVLVFADSADKLSFGDQRDSSRIPAGGTPGYTVWHTRAGWEISDSATLYLQLENITDVDYRVHGSGLNRPGRNLIVGFRTTF